MNFTIENIGTGVLTGAITTQDKWITVLPADFNSDITIVNVT